jgi:ABC-type glycerol-3-phosphate transport system permease component
MRAQRRLKQFVFDLPYQIPLMIMAISIFFLAYYLSSNALKPTSEFYRSEISIPSTISFDATLRALTEGRMAIALRNTVILVFGTVFLALLIGSLAAYALARLKLPYKTPIFVAMLIPMSISPIVITIPLFARLSSMGLVNTFLGGIVVYLGLRLSFTIFVLDGFFRELPDEIFDAARVDGCGPMGLFWRILLPLSIPGLVTVGLLNMLEVWNDLLIGLLFLANQDVTPISASVVAYQQKFSANPQMVFAGLLVAAIPMILIYFFTQRYFIEGISSGAFK